MATGDANEPYWSDSLAPFVQQYQELQAHRINEDKLFQVRRKLAILSRPAQQMPNTAKTLEHKAKMHCEMCTKANGV